MAIELLRKLKEGIPKVAKEVEKDVLMTARGALSAEEGFLKLRKTKYDVKKETGEELSESEQRELNRVNQKLMKVEAYKRMAEDKLKEVM